MTAEKSLPVRAAIKLYSSQSSQLSQKFSMTVVFPTCRAPSINKAVVSLRYQFKMDEVIFLSNIFLPCNYMRYLHFSNRKLFKYCIFPPRFHSIFALFQLFTGSNIQAEKAAEGGNCLFINSPESKAQSLQCLLFRANLTF